MIAAGSRSSSLPHPMPILILSRTRPSLRWERISVSHSIATAASPTAANNVGTLAGEARRRPLCPILGGQRTACALPAFRHDRKRTLTYLIKRLVSSSRWSGCLRRGVPAASADSMAHANGPLGLPLCISRESHPQRAQLRRSRHHPSGYLLSLHAIAQLPSLA